MAVSPNSNYYRVLVDIKPRNVATSTQDVEKHEETFWVMAETESAAKRLITQYCRDVYERSVPVFKEFEALNAQEIESLSLNDLGILLKDETCLGSISVESSPRRWWQVWKIR